MKNSGLPAFSPASSTLHPWLSLRDEFGDDSATDYSDQEDHLEDEIDDLSTDEIGLQRKTAKTDSNDHPGQRVIVNKEDTSALVSQLNVRLKAFGALLDKAGNDAKLHPQNVILGGNQAPESTLRSAAANGQNSANVKVSTNGGAAKASLGGQGPSSTQERPTKSDGYGNTKHHSEESATKADFYGEEMDDEDEAWVNKTMRSGGKAVSEAVLSCPFCFTTVCVECQRHAKYVNQWRAVRACNVVTGNMSDPRAISRNSQILDVGMKRKTDESYGNDDHQEIGEALREVLCECCNNQVGVLDESDVFHFFNVAPSHA